MPRSKRKSMRSEREFSAEQYLAGRWGAEGIASFDGDYICTGRDH